MENLNYLFAAFALVWVMIFYYTYHLSKKQKELVEEIRRIKELIKQKSEDNKT